MGARFSASVQTGPRPHPASYTTGTESLSREKSDRGVTLTTHLIFTFIYIKVKLYMETAVAQRLRCCATNLKVAGSIPAGVVGFLIDVKSFRSHYGPGVDSASNRNEYQEYFLGVKVAGA